MESKLSLLMVVKDAEQTVKRSLDSTLSFVDEIVVVDNGSIDKTIETVKKYGSRVFPNKSVNLGKLRQFGLSKCRGEWVLVLDSDEIISKELKEEIKSLLHRQAGKNQINGYYIYFQNHLFGKPLKYGGENYKKLVLFKKDKVIIKPDLVHEKFEVDGETSVLRNKILHYSYRTLGQIYRKFTDYAIREAKQKYFKDEKSSFKKIFLYPIHMFWARFINDKGYKDGLFRIPLDLGFAYMEFLTYCVLAIIRIKNYMFTLII